MDRRTFLAAVGAAGLAGCAGTTDGSIPGSETETPTKSTTAGKTAAKSATREATPTALPDDLLAVEQLRPVTETGGDRQRDGTFAAARIENASDRSIGKVTATAQWYDSAGDRVSTTRRWLYRFEPGAVWRALVPSEQGTSFTDVRVSADPIRRRIDPGPLSLSDSDSTTSDGVARVRGAVENRGHEDIFPTIFGTFYGEDGTILGGAMASVTNAPAGRTTSFELAFDYGRRGLSAPAESEIVLDTPDSTDIGCFCD